MSEMNAVWFAVICLFAFAWILNRRVLKIEDELACLKDKYKDQITSTHRASPMS
jgi:hypothetical protein